MGKDGVQKREPHPSVCLRPLCPEIRPDEIKEEFKEFGEILNVRIPVDFQTREPRGFAYIDFKDVQSAIDARETVHGKILFGRKVQVYYSTGEKKTPLEMTKNKELKRLKEQITCVREERNKIEQANKANVKGTMHFLKVAAELEATKKYQTKYVTRIRIDDRLPPDPNDKKKQDRNIRIDSRPKRRRSYSRSRSRSYRRSYSRSSSRSRSSYSRSPSRSRRRRKYSRSPSSSSFSSRSPSPRNFREKKRRRKSRKRSRKHVSSSSRSRSPSPRRKKRSRKYSRSRSRSSSVRRKRHRSSSSSSFSRTPTPPPPKKHSKKSKKKKRRRKHSSSSSYSS